MGQLLTKTYKYKCIYTHEHKITVELEEGEVELEEGELPGELPPLAIQALTVGSPSPPPSRMRYICVHYVCIQNLRVGIQGGEDP